MMFDMLQRCVLDKKADVVKYCQEPDRLSPSTLEVKVGKPMD